MAPGVAARSRQIDATRVLASTWHGPARGRYDPSVRSRDVAAAALAVLTACSLTTDLKGLSSSGGPGPDGSSSGSISSGGEGGGVIPADGSTVGTFDAGPDGSKGEVVPTAGVVIASNVSSYAAGSAQQHHVHFASNLGAYVVFYFSSQEKNALLTRLTPDFVTFVDGPSIPLPHPNDNEGRNFDVAYANIGGADVFHLIISIHDGPRFSYRVRGRATKGGALTFDAVSELDHDTSAFTTLDPDGPGIAILSSGRVVIGSGYNSVKGHTANAVVWVASKPDDGAPDWDHAFAPGLELEIASESVNARSLVAFPGGVSMMWERADHEPRPRGIGFSFFGGTTWTSPDDVGFTKTEFDIADWDQLATSDGHIHAVRFANGGYEHRYWDGEGRTGFTLAATEHSTGDGVVFLAKGASPSVFVLAKPENTLKRATLEGTTWSAWTDAAPADGMRSHLSGNADVVMWQRGNDLVGLRLP